MAKARLEIQRLLAEGRISPAEADQLLRALREGYPEEFAGETADPPEPAGDAPGPARQTFRAGERLELPEGACLRLESDARNDSAMGGLAIRGVPGSALTLVRGPTGEIRRDGDRFVLAWSSGLLLVEVPEKLGALEIVGMRGPVGLSGYAGPFCVEDLDGSLTVHDPPSPFRIRGVRGEIRLRRLALREGAASVLDSTGELLVEAGPDASVTVRAAAPGGVTFAESGLASGENGRAIWRVGGGTAELGVTLVEGRIILRRAAEGAGSDREERKA